MTTFTVTNLNDSGLGSFRAAILAANADSSGLPVDIKFAVNGVIHLASDLPAISKATRIDGTSAPAYAAAGHPVVEIDFNNHAGLNFSSGSSGSTLLGLALGNAAGNGVTLNASTITINKNYIGLHVDGSAFGNSGDGVFVSSLSSYNKIGDNPTAASGFIGNVISGNGGNGVSLHGSYGNILVDNHIGTNVEGSAAIANGQNGILLTDGAGGNVIGGTAFVDTSTGAVNNPTGSKGTTTPVFVVPALGNLVSGNIGNGILITNNSQNNVLNGNFVGTSADGNAAIGNGGNGVLILNASNNSLIGCDFVDNPFVYYNVLSGNGGNGLRITNSNNVTVQANFFGVGANNATVVMNGQNGILVDGNSQNVQVGGVIPLGNVSAGNKLNGIYVTDTVSGFTTFNTFGGLLAFQGAAPNGNDGILIDSTGGNNLIRTNVFSGNTNNGIELAGNASGVTVDPNIAGLNTIGNAVLANGANGLLITDTAHGNTIGGFLGSVIPQNTFSGNKGYGLAITGAAYDNTVINSVFGLGVKEKTALPNQSGGILLATSGTNNLIGGVTTNPQQPQHNHIGGNQGNGVDFAANSAGNQVINNVIGFGRFGETLPNTGQPIALNGAYANNVSGNTPVPAATTIGLPPQEVIAQVESLYVGYFGRAGDVDGVALWSNQTLKAMQNGASLFDAINTVSAAFAASPENTPYNTLANVALNPNNQAQVALATSFIKQVYQYSFGRPADADGVAFWLDTLFSGRVAFTSLVNVMNNAAQLTDLTNLDNKLVAATYFTELAHTASITPSLGAMVNAVKSVTNDTSLLASEAATNSYFGMSENQITYASAFQTFGVTGVRGEYNGNVVLTGSVPITSGGVTTVTASLYNGPLQDTTLGYVYNLTPQISGQSIKSSNFYGPSTSVFDPSIGRGNVIAVGSFVLNSSSDTHDHGMIYQGPVSGGGSWTQIDVPSSSVGGASVADTIPHSTMGDIVVGNYDLLDVPKSGNAFIYNKATKTWKIMDQDFGGTQQFTTLYGVWQNGVGSTSYTIIGGSNHGGPIQQGFIADYNSLTGQLSHITYLPAYNDPKDYSHFEGITAIPGGYNLSATTPNGPGYVTVTRNGDGSFGTTPQWTDTNMPGAKIVSGDSVYQNFNMGIYLLPDTPASDPISTYTGLVNQGVVDPFGGLIMKMGSLNYAYATTVQGGVGALIVGSSVASNVLGGSIGNDIFVGVQIAGKQDTIFTGGGADQIQLSAGRTAPTHIELYASNQINSAQPVVAGSTMPALSGSVVTASDVPQLGWWGQATGQVGGPVSNASTNLGHGVGTSADIALVSNFNVGTGASQGDSIDLSLTAYSNLLRSTNSGSAPTLGNAILSNAVLPGGTIAVANSDVIVISGTQQYANANAVATALTTVATSINFATAQNNTINHYVLAYQDMTGSTRIADMDIHNPTAFTNTANVATLAVSDLVQLTGVDLSQIQASNIQFVA